MPRERYQQLPRLPTYQALGAYLPIKKHLQSRWCTTSRKVVIQVPHYSEVVRSRRTYWVRTMEHVKRECLIMVKVLGRITRSGDMAIVWLKMSVIILGQLSVVIE